MATIGWRMETFRPGENTRNFTPEVAGSISFDASRDIPKAISGIVVPPNQWSVVDVRVDQIRLWLDIDGVANPMGYYVFSELTRQKYAVVDSSGAAADLINTGLSDRCMLLNRNTGSGTTVAAGFDPSQEMIRILSAAGVPYSIAAATNTSTTSVTWDGTTTDLSKLQQMGTLAGHRPLWMDNNGVVRSVSSQVIDTEIIPLSSLQPVDRSISITEKFLTAPNRVIVSDNSSGSAAIRGVWDAPASAPHSFANRGYVQTDTVEEQGLGSGDHAQNVAATIGENYTARSLSANVIPTPLLDGPAIISYDGANWLISGWSVDLTPGATMTINAEELIS